MIRKDNGASVLIGSGQQWPCLWRGAVLLLLAVFVCTQFATTQHELSTRHAVCLEHGELIDLDSPSGSSAAAPSDGTRLSADNAAEQQNHQHCMFVASRDRRNAFVLTRVALIHFSQAPQYSPVSQAETVHTSVALYRSAPKHSPPTTA